MQALCVHERCLLAAIRDWAERSPERPPWPGAGTAGPVTRPSRSARASWRVGTEGQGGHDGRV
jgi:hypothetical protein